MGLHKIRKQLFFFFFLEMATIDILMEPVKVKETKGKERRKFSRLGVYQIFLKRPNGNYFRLPGLYRLCHKYPAPLLCPWSSPKHRGARLCSNQTSRKQGSGLMWSTGFQLPVPALVALSPCSASESLL